MSKKIMDNCAICREFRKMTFEHLPPEKAFNNLPVFNENHNNLVERSSPYFGKKSLLNQGFGAYSLCQQCNSETGSWYGESYIQWAHQGMELLNQNNGSSFIRCNFSIKPLNVIKQVMSFFLSADRAGIYSDDLAIRNFIKEKESNDLPDKYRIYLYLNNSKKHRLLGAHFIKDPAIRNIYKWSEFNFRPFGFLLGDDSPPANALQYDITFFKNYAYNSYEHFRLPLFYLEVDHFEIGRYSNLKDNSYRNN